MSRTLRVWEAFADADEAELVRGHLEHMTNRNLRPVYIQARLCMLARMRRGLGCPLLEATHDGLYEWLDTRKIAPESRGAELAHVRMFYAWAVDEELLTRDPARRLVRPRHRRRLPRPMPDADLALALEHAPPRVRSILHLAALAGLRACEIGALRAEDILTSSDGTAMLVVRDGKGGKQRVVPASDELLAVLRTDDVPKTGLLFGRADGSGEAVSRSRICQLANRYLHDLGIAHTLHTLRHWFGTRIYQGTHDLRLTQELMGHSDPNTTAGYAAWSPAEGAVAVAALQLP